MTCRRWFNWWWLLPHQSTWNHKEKTWTNPFEMEYRLPNLQFWGGAFLVFAHAGGEKLRDGSTTYTYMRNLNSHSSSRVEKSGTWISRGSQLAGVKNIQNLEDRWKPPKFFRQKSWKLEVGAGEPFKLLFGRNKPYSPTQELRVLAGHWGKKSPHFSGARNGAWEFFWKKLPTKYISSPQRYKGVWFFCAKGGVIGSLV